MPTIILVEDDDVTRMVSGEILRRQGHRVVPMRDAYQLSEVVAAERPDVVLLDLMLPGESGFEACRRLKSNRALAHTRVIILSCRHEFEDVRAALECGAERFLAKPLRLDVVRRILDDAPAGDGGRSR